MRTMILLGLLVGGGLWFGWPAPWVIVCSAFIIGVLARRPTVPPREASRPGYLPIVSAPPGTDVVTRVNAYSSAPAPYDPQAFGLPLERPEYGDCEGCGGS